MIGPRTRLTFLAKNALPVLAGSTSGFAELSIFPSTLALMTLRGRIRSSLVPKPLPVRPVGSGSTPAEKIELITLPAMRPCIVPPFWAMGWILPVAGLGVGLATDGGGWPLNAPPPAEKTLAAGVLA